MSDLLQFMFEDGVLSASEIVALRRTCRELNENPVRILRSLNIMKPQEIQAYFQRFFGIQAVTDQLVEALDESFKSLIPTDLAINFGAFAVAEDGDTLHVALEDPTDKAVLHKLQFFLGRRIVPVSATVEHLAVALTRLYEVELPMLKLSTIMDTSRGLVSGSIASADNEIDSASDENPSDENPSNENLTESSPTEEMSDEETTANLTQRIMAQDDGSLDEEMPGAIEDELNDSTGTDEDLNALISPPTEEAPLEETSLEETSLEETSLEEPALQALDDPFGESPLEAMEQIATPLDETEENNDVPAALTTEEISEVTLLLNPLLVRLSMVNDAETGIRMTNETLAQVGAHLDLSDEKIIHVEWKGTTRKGLIADREERDPIITALLPAVRKILKLKKA